MCSANFCFCSKNSRLCAYQVCQLKFLNLSVLAVDLLSSKICKVGNADVGIAADVDGNIEVVG